MFGLSFWEIAIILAVALILLGPKKLPELARNLGKGIREFRRATEDFRTTMVEETREADPPKTARAALPADKPKALPVGDAPEASARGVEPGVVAGTEAPASPEGSEKAAPEGGGVEDAGAPRQG